MDTETSRHRFPCFCVSSCRERKSEVGCIFAPSVTNVSRAQGPNCSWAEKTEVQAYTALPKARGPQRACSLGWEPGVEREARSDRNCFPLAGSPGSKKAIPSLRLCLRSSLRQEGTRLRRCFSGPTEVGPFHAANVCERGLQHV